MTSIALNCMILGDSPDFAFVVHIDLTKRIDDLKSAIKKKRPDVFGDSPAVNMVLWKVDIALDVANEKLSALQRGESRLCIDIELGGEKLRALQQIGKAFSVLDGDDDDGETVRVLIERVEESSSSPARVLRRSRSVFDKEKLVDDWIDDTEVSLNKRRRTTAYTSDSVNRQSSEPDVFAGFALSQGSVASQNLTREVREKGLDYYYDAGKSASANTTWSIAKIDDTLRVQRIFFQFQKERGKSEEWPKDGLSIGMVHFLMQLGIDTLTLM
jgi:hypothetical protein